MASPAYGISMMKYGNAYSGCVSHMKWNMNPPRNASPVSMPSAPIILYFILRFVIIMPNTTITMMTICMPSAYVCVGMRAFE